MFNEIKDKAVALIAPMVGLGLTVTSSGVTVDAADVATVQSANEGYLTTIFQILEFIPTIAIVAGGMYLLNKVFSFIPKSGSSN